MTRPTYIPVTDPITSALCTREIVCLGRRTNGTSLHLLTRHIGDTTPGRSESVNDYLIVVVVVIVVVARVVVSVSAVTTKTTTTTLANWDYYT